MLLLLLQLFFFFFSFRSLILWPENEEVGKGSFNTVSMKGEVDTSLGFFSMPPTPRKQLTRFQSLCCQAQHRKRTLPGLQIERLHEDASSFVPDEDLGFEMILYQTPRNKQLQHNLWGPKAPSSPVAQEIDKTNPVGKIAYFIL